MAITYFVRSKITLADFMDGMKDTDIDCQLDDSPTNFYPFIRLIFNDSRMIARTNVHGVISGLQPIDGETNATIQMVEAITKVFSADIFREEFVWGSKLLARMNMPEEVMEW